MLKKQHNFDKIKKVLRIINLATIFNRVKVNAIDNNPVQFRTFQFIVIYFYSRSAR